MANVEGRRRVVPIKQQQGWQDKLLGIHSLAGVDVISEIKEKTIISGALCLCLCELLGCGAAHMHHQAEAWFLHCLGQVRLPSNQAL